MAFRIEFTPSALREVFEAVDWYLEKAPGQEERLWEDIRDTLAKLKVFNNHRVRRFGLRYIHLNVFPYVFHYRREPSEVITLAAFLHVKRGNNTSD